MWIKFLQVLAIVEFIKYFYNILYKLSDGMFSKFQEQFDYKPNTNIVADRRLFLITFSLNLQMAGGKTKQPLLNSINQL